MHDDHYTRDIVEAIRLLASRVRFLEARPYTSDAGVVTGGGGGGGGTTGVGEGPDIDLVGNIVGRGGDTILQFSSLWQPVAEFDPSDAGMVAVLTSVMSGDMIMLPVGIIPLTSAHVVPAGVTILGFGPETCAFDLSGGGDITLGNASRLHNLTFEGSLSSASDFYGVKGPIQGTSYIDHCWIVVENTGAGNAYAIGAINGFTSADGSMQVRYSHLYGSSIGGDGYGGRSTRGVIYAWHSRIHGSAGAFTLL